MKLTGGYSIQDRIYYSRLFIGSKNKMVQRIIPMKIREIELINPLESASPENCNKSFGTIVNGKLAASAMSTGFLVEFVFFSGNSGTANRPFRNIPVSPTHYPLKVLLY